MANEMRPADYVELGILYVKEGRYQEAYRSLRQAMLHFGDYRVNEIPYPLLSYYGLCLVALGKESARGLTFCRRAVDEAGTRSDFYWNLGKAYLFLDRKPQAIKAFQNGLQIQDDRRIVAELTRLGVRSRPLIPFLSRSHVVNRYLGLLRARSRS